MESSITNIDFKTRMQYISCCLGNKGSNLIKDLELGKSCKKEQKFICSVFVHLFQ